LHWQAEKNNCVINSCVRVLKIVKFLVASEGHLQLNLRTRTTIPGQRVQIKQNSVMLAYNTVNTASPLRASPSCQLFIAQKAGEQFKISKKCHSA